MERLKGLTDRYMFQISSRAIDVYINTMSLTWGKLFGDF